MLTASLLMLISQPVAPVAADVKATVTNHDTTAVFRNGERVEWNRKYSISLEKGDIVINCSDISFGEIKLEDGTLIKFQSQDARIRYLGGDMEKTTLLFLEYGDIYVNRPKGKNVGPNDQSNGKTVEPPQDNDKSSRKKLIRTSQRSLGTRGTEFTLEYTSDFWKETLKLRVISGAVFCDKLGDGLPEDWFYAGKPSKDFKDDLISKPIAE